MMTDKAYLILADSDLAPPLEAILSDERGILIAAKDPATIHHEFPRFVQHDESYYKYVSRS